MDPEEHLMTHRPRRLAGHPPRPVRDPAPATPELRLAISAVQSISYGDHGDRHPIAHEYVPGETVEDLIRRAFPKLAGKWQQHDPTDVVEIRVAVDRDGKVPDLLPGAPGGDHPWGVSSL